MKVFAFIALLIFATSAYAVNPEDYVSLDDSVGDWKVDRLGGNTWAGNVFYQGIAREAGDIRQVVAVAETPEGIYVASSLLAHATARVSLIQNGNLRMLMDYEGDMSGPIELCQGGFFAWSESDSRLYLVGPECLRRVYDNGGGERKVEVVAGVCGTTGTTDATGTSARLQRNQGIAATSDGTIYWLELDRLRSITTAGVVDTVELTWTGRDEQTSPFWSLSGGDLIMDNISVGETDDILYINDLYDTTFGYGTLKVIITEPGVGTIEKFIGAPGGETLTAWDAEPDYDTGTLMDGTPDNLENEAIPGVWGIISKGSAEARYHDFYGSVLLAGNDNVRYRWYTLGADNVKTFFGDWNDDDPTYNITKGNSLAVDGGTFFRGPIARFVGAGRGKGIYVGDSGDAGLFRAYDSTMVDNDDKGEAFEQTFADTSVASARDGRIRAALMSTDGTLSAASFEVASLGSGIQTQPKIAYLDGKYLVVWAQLSGDDWNVYGARVSDTGTVLDDPPLEIDVTGRTQTMPDVAADDTNFMVVWGGFDSSETYATDPKSYVYAMRVPLTGAITDTRTEIDQGSSPEISYNATEDLFAIVYATSRDNWTRVTRWRVINPDKTSVTEGVTDYANGGSTTNSFAITSLPGSEGWTWTVDGSERDRGNKTIGSHRAFTIYIDVSDEVAYDVAQVADGLSGDIPSHFSNGDIISRGATPDWYIEYDEDLLSTEWPMKSNALAKDATYAVAVWGRHALSEFVLSDSDLHIGLLAKYDLVEASVEDLAVTSDSERNPAIAGDGSGDLVVVYEKILAGERVIASKSLDISGTTITVNSENAIVDEDDDLYRGYPDIAYNTDDDDYMVVWQEGADSLTTYVYPFISSSGISASGVSFQ